MCIYISSSHVTPLLSHVYTCDNVTWVTEHVSIYLRGCFTIDYDDIEVVAAPPY